MYTWILIYSWDTPLRLIHWKLQAIHVCAILQSTNHINMLRVTNDIKKYKSKKWSETFQQNLWSLTTTMRKKIEILIAYQKYLVRIEAHEQAEHHHVAEDRKRENLLELIAKFDQRLVPSNALFQSHVASPRVSGNVRCLLIDDRPDPRQFLLHHAKLVEGVQVQYAQEEVAAHVRDANLFYGQQLCECCFLISDERNNERFVIYLNVE